MAQDAYLAALQVERQGYLLRGLSDRVKAVDAEIARAGGKAPAAVPADVEPEKPKRK